MWLQGKRKKSFCCTLFILFVAIQIVGSHSQVIIPWPFGLVAGVQRQTKTIFDNMGMRLNSQLSFSRNVHIVALIAANQIIVAALEKWERFGFFA